MAHVRPTRSVLVFAMRHLGGVMNVSILLFVKTIAAIIMGCARQWMSVTASQATLANTVKHW